MTLDPGRAPGQVRRPPGGGERIDAFLMGPLLAARGAVNCDLMARRLSREHLLELRRVMIEGAALIADVLGLEDTSDTTE